MQTDIGVVLTPAVPVVLLQDADLKQIEAVKSQDWKESTETVKNDLICNLCGKSFSRKSTLNRHMKQHSGVKPYVCSFNCGKSFSTIFNCKRHELQHTSEYPYECPYEDCTRRFKSRSALNYHKKTHSGKKEYVCTYGDCKMKFLSQSNLTKHMITHSQEAEFHCPLCERRYKRKWDLTRHIKKVHQSKDDEDVYNNRFASILEQNRQQAEMINFLLERNKQLQEKLSETVVSI